MKNKLDIQPKKLIRLLGNKITKDESIRFAKIISKGNKISGKIDVLYRNNDFMWSFLIENGKDFKNKYPVNKKEITIFYKTKDIHEVFICGIQILSKKFNINYPNNCLVYCHIGSSFIKDKGHMQYNYHGYTSRTMPIRMKEHKKANSNFGNSYRESMINKIEDHYHFIVADGLTKSKALDLEEKVIDANSLFRDGQGNNMIPGGKKGERIARHLGYKDRESAEIDLEESLENPDKLEKICAKAYNWLPMTDLQIANFVFSQPKNFTREEIRFIRLCSLSTDKIAEVCKLLRNKFEYYSGKEIYQRVKSVINGETYRFSA